MGESDPDETECTSAASGSESDLEEGNVTDNPTQRGPDQVGNILNFLLNMVFLERKMSPQTNC